MQPSTTHRYTHTAIALHWILAIALAGIFGVGLYMADLPFSPWRLKLYNWHKWAGITILALSALRLIWRLTHRPPALPDHIQQTMPAWQRWAHHAIQYGLYVLFFAVPLIGWAYSSAAGFPVVLFGVWQLPDWVPVSKSLAESIKPLHEISANTLAILVVVHVAAAFKHHFVNRDGLLWRMWPRRSGNPN
jgi:cytochrome b561